MGMDLQTAEREKTYAERCHALEADLAKEKAKLARAEKDRDAWAQRVLEAERERDDAIEARNVSLNRDLAGKENALAVERAHLENARLTIHKVADAFGLVDWSDGGRYVQASDASVVTEAQGLGKRLDKALRDLTDADEVVRLVRGESCPDINSPEEWLSEMAEQGHEELHRNWARLLKMQMEMVCNALAAEQDRAAEAEKQARELERDLDDANTTIAVLREELARATEGARDAHIREAVALAKATPADALGVRVERLEKALMTLCSRASCLDHDSTLEALSDIADDALAALKGEP